MAKMLYSVSFTLNGNPASSMWVNEDMLFAELAFKFCEYFGIKGDNKTTFIFNSGEIKSESTKKLKELGIVQMSVINVTTEKPVSMPVNNAFPANNAGNMGNFQMNNNQFMQNNFQNMNINPGYNGYNGFVNPGYMNNQYMYNAFMNNGYNNMAQNVNNQNANNQNVNYQNVNNQNINNQNTNNSNGNFLDIVFNYKGQPIHVQSTSDAKFCELYQKLSNKIGNPQTPPSFSYNNQTIQSTDTRKLTELSIVNQATIQVLESGSQPPSGNGDFLNIIFTCQGRSINFQATKDTKIHDLAKRFAAKFGQPEQVPTFFMNSMSIDINQDKTLEDLKIKNQAKIDVVFTAQVIGA